MSPATVIARRPLAKQAHQVFAELVRRGSAGLTARDAMSMVPPCYRLAARIADVREAFGADSVRTVRESHGAGEHARYVWTLTDYSTQETLDL